MTTIMKMLAGSAAIAALGAASPAAAQYGYPYGYNTRYVNPYAYNVSQMATQRCTAAVQARLSNRTSLGGILASLFGVRTAASTGRVLSITQVDPNRGSVRVRGLASSGRYAGYSPYGVGYYGSLAYAYQPDLRFRCDVDYRGYVRDIDIDRR
ncbi:MAG TPA: hypothetical protein VFP53_03865 [Sphingomicrobium sp.]|nr:hypothetical protein [Sphingomicrobium sp.]